jgi:Zn ribbon nucleic-acid-binding protein
MGAFSYCRNCERPLSMPDLEDAVIGHRECPDCGTREWIDDFHRKVLVLEVNERIERLEKIVKILAKKLKEK